MYPVKVIKITPSDIDRREIFRYLNCPTPGETENNILDMAINKTSEYVNGIVAYTEFPVSIDNNSINLGFAVIESQHLAINLNGCSSIILFAATIGHNFERQIKRYSATDPAMASFVNAFGAERVEAVCDEFNEMIAKEKAEEGKTLRPRYSPGYGDVSLSLQKDIMIALDCQKNLGIVLDEHYFMTPSKSVTAIIGVR